MTSTAPAASGELGRSYFVEMQQPGDLQCVSTAGSKREVIHDFLLATVQRLGADFDPWVHGARESPYAGSFGHYDAWRGRQETGLALRGVTTTVRFVADRYGTNRPSALCFHGLLNMVLKKINFRQCTHFTIPSTCDDPRAGRHPITPIVAVALERKIYNK